MAIQNRNTTLPGIWASTAQTTIPTPPVAGVTYRDTTLNSTAIDKAWPFKTIVDSSDFNQHAFLQDTLIKEAEQYGVMRWNNTTTYKKGGLCLAQDEKIYRAIRDNQGKDPTSNPDDWKIPFAIDADIVHKTGDETINGRKTIDTGKSESLNIKSFNIDQDVNPEDNQYSSYINFFDVNNKLMGRIFASKETDGRQGISIQAFYNKRNVTVGVRVDENDAYTYVSTPPSDDNSTRIANTAWVNNFVNKGSLDEGYVYIGNLLLQWGSASRVGTDQTITVPLIRPYVNTSYFVGNVNLSSGTGAAGDPSCNAVGTRTTTNFQLRQDQTTNKGITGTLWFAIGKGA